MAPEEKLAEAVDGLLLYLRRAVRTLLVIQVVLIGLICGVLYAAHGVVEKTNQTKEAIESKTEIDVEGTDSSARLIFKAPDGSTSVTVPLPVTSDPGGPKQ